MYQPQGLGFSINIIWSASLLVKCNRLNKAVLNLIYSQELTPLQPHVQNANHTNATDECSSAQYLVFVLIFFILITRFF